MRRVNMSLKHGLLGLLNYGDMTGYKLDKMFKESLHHFWQAQTSQIYKELNTMQEKGWLTSKLVYQSDKPNKKIYSLTEAGKTELFDWLKKDAIKEAMIVKEPFLMRLFFASEIDSKVNLEMLQLFQDACKEQLDLMEKANQIIDSHKGMPDFEERSMYWQMTASYGTDYYRMCFEWSQKMIDMIKKADKIK